LALAAAICACLASVVADAITVRGIQELGPPRPGDLFSPLSGLTAKHEWIGVPADHRCHLVRFASDQCRYSKADDPRFRALESRLLKEGCDSAILAPASSLFPSGYAETDTRRLFYDVNLGFSRKAKLIRTPTTMLFDRDWRLTWRAEGILNDMDLLGDFHLGGSGH